MFSVYEYYRTRYPLFYVQKQAHSSLKGRAGQLGEKFFKNGCPLTLGKCGFRACVTKYPYPPPFCFKRL